MTDTAIIIRKLEAAIAECSPNGLARPLWVAEVHDIIQVLEHQQAQIAASAPRPLTHHAALGEIADWPNPMQILPDTDTGTALQKILEETK